MRQAGFCLVLLLPVATAHAADEAKARQALFSIYDIGLYNAELDRVLAEAEGKGIYGGNTPVNRARDKAMTRSAMTAQRDAVLNAAIPRVAARASNDQLGALLKLVADPNAAVDRRLVDGAVVAVKAGFNDALWDQVARTARGKTEFPCGKNEKSRCFQ